ncbi:ATPase domain-containing protein [Caenispirillum salinarum]|uniref:ATPase domain-containing protein n=1 Tax=Caenispirillum salinarum TaxID=859058 RepID=UPI00384D29AC
MGQAVEKTLIGTGIGGLDHILNGGLPPGRAYVVVGEPGTGKTTFGLHFVLEGLKKGERVLFLTLSQTADELLGIARSHDMDIGDVIVRELSPDRLARAATRDQTVLQTSDVEFAATMDAIEAIITETAPSRLVLDTVADIRLLSSSPLRFRRQFVEIKDMLGRHGVTGVILDTAESSNILSGDIDALAHGVIRMTWTLPPHGTARRRIAVTKLRGHAFVEGYHDMTIRRGGVEVYPRILPRQHETDKPVPSLGSGIGALDALYGGQLAGGGTLMLAGYAGTGKSTLLTAYARNAASEGRRAALFLFEERPDIFRQRAAQLSLDLEGQPGEVELARIDPMEVSPGQLFQRIQAEVHAGADIIGIDSLQGLVAAMPGEREALTQIHSLLSFLGRHKVLTILTMNIQGMVGTGTRPDVDMSLMADTILLLRQYEATSEIRRTVAVVKKRYGPHETVLREFTITSDGISVRPIRDDVDMRRHFELGVAH